MNGLATKLGLDHVGFDDEEYLNVDSICPFTSRTLKPTFDQSVFWLAFHQTGLELLDIPIVLTGGGGNAAIFTGSEWGCSEEFEARCS